MSILDETYTLSNGVTIPKLGLGTWFIDDASVAEAVHQAIGIGYRNIDTAQAYGNERGVGEGVRDSGVAREELFVLRSASPTSCGPTSRTSSSTARWPRT